MKINSKVHKASLHFGQRTHQRNAVNISTALSMKDKDKRILSHSI